MHLISNEANSDIRDKICALFSTLDLRRWSGNEYYAIGVDRKFIDVMINRIFIFTVYLF